MSGTGIEWTDRVWNCIRGCSLVSEGCRSCYAMKQAHRFSGPNGKYHGLTEIGPRGPRWTGKVVCDESKLREPLSWRKPSRVFVNSMSDLFHEDVADAFIERVFAVMALAPRHTFQILTKRPERMRRFFEEPNRAAAVAVVAKGLSKSTSPFTLPDERVFEARLVALNLPWMIHAWPLPNIWAGVSVENQETADERIPLLLQTPAAVRFISAEPLLGPIDLRPYMPNVLWNNLPSWKEPELDWVIVGGESGPGARHFDLAWGRSILAQCQAAGVPVFTKQLGSKPMAGRMPHPDDMFIRLRDRKGGDTSEWPEDLRVRQFPREVPA